MKYKFKTSLQVIKINGDQYDLRFFGGTHDRITVEKAYIRPISININSLQVSNKTLLVLYIIVSGQKRLSQSPFVVGILVNDPF